LEGFGDWMQEIVHTDNQHVPERRIDSNTSRASPEFLQRSLSAPTPATQDTSPDSSERVDADRCIDLDQIHLWLTSPEAWNDVRQDIEHREILSLRPYERMICIRDRCVTWRIMSSYLDLIIKRAQQRDTVSAPSGTRADPAAASRSIVIPTRRSTVFLWGDFLL